MTAFDHSWLLSRTRPNDPVGWSYRTIDRLVVKQALTACLQAMERRLGYRVCITEGWAQHGHNPGSEHYTGRACDLVLLIPPQWRELIGPALEAAIPVVAEIAAVHGFRLINEYKDITPATTAGHLHLEWEGKGA